MSVYLFEQCGLHHQTPYATPYSQALEAQSGAMMQRIDGMQEQVRVLFGLGLGLGLGFRVGSDVGMVLVEFFEVAFCYVRL